MPFTFSQIETKNLAKDDLCIEDRRNSPVRGRKTKFRLAQQNILAYTFPDFIPGFAEHGINAMPYRELIDRPLDNALQEGDLLYGVDFKVDSNAKSKVAGDVYEEISSAVLWNAAAWWNRFMVDDSWLSKPKYARPTVKPSPARQVAILRLPRSYDWVRLLEPSARDEINKLRKGLDEKGFGLPTSTPDLAVVVLPEELRDDDLWRTPLPDLKKPSQAILTKAHEYVEGRVSAGEIILAIAFKTSLRSDRLYQPLYEANVMQLLLEGHLGAPKVEFEVHTLESAGTNAKVTYTAASLYAVAKNDPDVHRAVRELYHPTDAGDLVKRMFAFLNERMALV
ncbi:Cfr10I/Bse634I family restriction endonuclease [Streptomyces sp. MUM 2J]|uniref:Cfr10I/Bse634I family restriction endonuclease n=1 Tax=Streptomyces sp. MUM 2J TaxID=2791987 RepID=UPI001F04063C|nr:Cfr10I/Bse634I family restriction endonuclease [Streptomyces sp. MUM 2J]MCH0567406.1 Cfr10I/Bse634I family restriction endonuclease [Streptomyces sp. MUM 2J]